MKYNINVFAFEDELSHKKAIFESIYKFSKNSPYINLEIQDNVNYLKLYHDDSSIAFKDNDIVLIDIHLNTSFTGIELAKKIREKNSRLFILYLTSDETLVWDSINTQTYPTGYLVKESASPPVSDNVLFPFLRDIQNIILRRIGDKSLVEIRTSNQIILIDPMRIYYVETIPGIPKKTVFETVDSQFTANERLSDLKLKLDFPFFFLNLKSYIINTSLIESFNRVEESITFKNGKKLFLGKKQITKVKNSIN
ncbi:LytR/AlgR family response regulator transcription factor [Enterococcus sp. LJL120]